MAIDGPINIQRMKEYLQKADSAELDELIQTYLNAFLIQQRLIIAIGPFEKNKYLLPQTKEILKELIVAANRFIEDFNNKSLLITLESSLAHLQSQLGYVVNFSNQSLACNDIYLKLEPIKKEIANSVSIDSLVDSFVLIEESTNDSISTKTLASAPPPPPPPPIKEKATIPTAAQPKTASNPAPEEELTCKDELLRKLRTIDKELTSATSLENKTESEEANPIPKLALNLKRELTAKALDAERRRNLKRFADVRSDPTLPTQLNPNSSSKGLIFLSMLRSQIGERKERTLKAAAAQQKAPSAPLPNGDIKDIDTSFQKLKLN